MTDMWDIARHVEIHPDDHENRWRLAKKMYMAWEYRHALEHLQVLKNEGPQKLNVHRYLAATYYRLGRHAESISELNEAVKIWPGEISLREQLARVLEVSGDRAGAAEVWEEVKAADPGHPLAGKAVTRLRKAPQETPEEDLRLADSDSGIDLRRGQVCTNCGAQNSDEFDRCWQCLAPLPHVQPGVHTTPRPVTRAEPALKPETVKLIAGLSVVGLLSVAVYLSLRLLARGAEAGQAVPVILSLQELYTRELGITRVVTGCVMLLVWPISLLGAVNYLRDKHTVPTDLVVITGLFLGALTYLGSWIDPRSWPIFLMLPLGLAFAAAKVAFCLPPWRALGVCGLHLVIVFAAACSAVVFSERAQLGVYLNPLTEAHAIWRYAQETRGQLEPGVHPVIADRPPFRRRVVWHSTGSRWLDRRAGDIQFIVSAGYPDGRHWFELKKEDASGTRIYEQIMVSPWKRTYLVKTDEPYEIIIDGEGDTVEVTLAGMLIPEVLE